MDFMKVLDQTVRELKREVNLKILNVPEIEQKVLDATDDEPWGPHGTALAEIAQATKKFTECQMVMDVLWTRLGETGKNWRNVYKALAVIEYLVSRGSERAVNEIIEHTYQISSLARFEYVEPSGKDMGINVRKKAENIVALLNDKDKILEVRNKAAANRDKYFGLSSSGVTIKSGTASLSSTSFKSNDRYGGFGSTSDGDYGDTFRNKDPYDRAKFSRSTSAVSRREVASDSGNSFKKGSSRKDRNRAAAGASKTTMKRSESEKNASIPSRTSIAPSNNIEDDDDDFNPRGTSSSKPSAGSTKQVDLFGPSLVDDLLDAPTPVSADKSTTNRDPPVVDLFGDATFVSAASQQGGGSSGAKSNVDLFASQPSPSAVPSTINVDLFASQPSPSAVPSTINVDLFASQATPSKDSPTIDFFAATDNKSTNTKEMPSNTGDPFASVPLNNFDTSDPFGAFTSPSNAASTGASQNAPKASSHGDFDVLSVDTKSPPSKKDNLQVKSGIWADSLSRGLIDLNITGPKKANLAEVGVVGSLSDGADPFYMGGATGAGSSHGNPGFSSTTTGVDDFFSSLSNKQYQYGSFKK